MFFGVMAGGAAGAPDKPTLDSPADMSYAVIGETIALAATAGANTTSVQWVADPGGGETIIATDSSSPYSATPTVALSAGAHTMVARAVGPGGSTDSDPIDITVADNPANILGSALKVWWRADDVVGSPVTQFNDKSGNGNHGIATGSPTLNASGGPLGTPSVLFDGTTGQYIDCAGFNFPTPGTTPSYVWAVFRQKTWTNGERFMTSINGVTMVIYQNSTNLRIDRYNGTTQGNTAMTLDTYFRGEFLFSNNASDYTKIGSTVTTGNAGNSIPASGLRLCRTNGGGATYGHYEICELIIYNGTAPTTAQRAALDAYCEARYGTGPLA